MKILKNKSSRKACWMDTVRKGWRTLCGVASSCLLAASAFATEEGGGEFAKSKFATGTKNLVVDIMYYLVILCPLFGGAFAVYYLIRRSMADETDGKMWTKRITTAIICGVLGSLVSGIIATGIKYFA